MAAAGAAMRNQNNRSARGGLARIRSQCIVVLPCWRWWRQNGRSSQQEEHGHQKPLISNMLILTCSSIQTRAICISYKLRCTFVEPQHQLHVPSRGPVGVAGQTLNPKALGPPQPYWGSQQIMAYIIYGLYKGHMPLFPTNHQHTTLNLRLHICFHAPRTVCWGGGYVKER